MKHIFYILLFVYATAINAQSFVLTPTGFVDSIDNKSTYVVVPFEGKNQEEIYNLALKATKNIITKIEKIQNAEEKIEQEKFKEITINGVVPNITTKGSLIMGYNYNLFFKLTLEFKDNKMRVNAPQIVDIKTGQFHVTANLRTTSYIRRIYLNEEKKDTHYIFKKNGKIKSAKNKEDIETGTNQYIRRILSQMNDIENKKEEEW